MPDWLARILSEVSALQLLLWVALVVGVVIGLVKVWPIISAIVRLADALTGLPEFIARTERTLEKQDGTLATIRHEVLPNHGGSLRDAVDHQARAIDSIKEKLDNDNERIADLERLVPRSRPKEVTDDEQTRAD